MNIGIIGTGAIAHKMAKAINNVDGITLFAVSSRSLQKARAFAEEHNVSIWYEGTDDFFNNNDIDLVYIASPNSCHFNYNMEAIKNKKAVLCEKPFTMNSLETKEILNYAKEQKVLVVEAMWTKHFPAIKKVKELLLSESFGDIISIHGDLCYSLSETNERLYSKSMGGGALLDLGVYPISITHYLLGKPQNIMANSVFSDSGVDLTTSVIFGYENGPNVLLSCSIIASSTNEFIISCSKGWIRINGPFHHPSSISCFIQGAGEQHKEFPLDNYGYEYQIKGLLDDYKNGLKESSTVTHKETIEVMEIMDKIREIIGYSFHG